MYLVVLIIDETFKSQESMKNYLFLVPVFGDGIIIGTG